MQYARRRDLTVPDSPQFVDIALEQGALRVQPLAPHTFRIRLTHDGHFGEPSLIRYGILRRDWPEVEYTTEESEQTVIIATTQTRLTISRPDGQLILQDAGGHELLRQTAPPLSSPTSGFRAEFALGDADKLYGLGDVTRDCIEKRGFMANMWVTNVASYVPIPVLLSTRGWGILANTTWRHYFDVGASQGDRLAFGARRGELDYYLIAGADLPALLNRYTDIAGKPGLLPLWGYGLTFVCNQQADAREMLDDCLNLRREDIPCDLVGLEPGWMEEYYDYSVEKKWHPERFYLPTWGSAGPHTFLAAAGRLGFKMSLWLCCNYDLSHEEERRAGIEPDAEPELNEFHPDDFERDAHFGHGPTLMDQLTKPEEPWFGHLKEFVDYGVGAFKMDGALQVNEHPDRKWANGMDDEEMHNLYPTLLNKQMSLGFREHTGKRAMIYSSGGYTGIQQYSATWAGDTGGGPKTLVSMLNHGLSGHAHASCDMDVFTPAGIHFGFLQAWSQVCSWAYWRHPWLLGDELLPIFKYYARLRYRLLPYIYSMAHVAARTGLPIMRAMPLAFSDCARADELNNQYLFGDWFLTGAFTDQIHLPAGRWIDYWTGQAHEGPVELSCQIPEGRGGPLFVRAGAIIPEWPEMAYVGQKPMDALSLHVYPHADSSFTLYEDDGETHQYLEGGVATTTIDCSHGEGQMELVIGARQGSYGGMPESRSFDVHLHVESAPDQVAVDGQSLERGTGGWEYDGDAGSVRLRVRENPDRSSPAIVTCRW